MNTRLFHFSEEGDIVEFAPRYLRTPSPREPGKEWLNGPLVWAIDEWHQPMYLFPRDCPRVLVWPVASTTEQDLSIHWRGCSARMIAYAEQSWFERLSRTTLFRYELPMQSFEDLRDSGMWVPREEVQPICVDRIYDLPSALRRANVELRVVISLHLPAALLATTLHGSALRMRNAIGWQG